MMKESVLNLIEERTEKVSLAIELLKKKFGDINFVAAKNCGEIPKSGFLDESETVSYNLHGRGCDVDFGGERIEFDFNFLTKNHLGFNVGWLKAFLNRHKTEFQELADLSFESLQTLLVELKHENRIAFDEAENLYFLPDSLKIEIVPKPSEVELALS